METFSLLQLLLLGVLSIPWLIVSLVPPAAVIISCLIHFWTRGRSYPELSSKFNHWLSVKLWCNDDNQDSYSWQNAWEHGSFIWLTHIIMGFCLVLLWGCIIKHTEPMTGVYIVSVGIMLILPRYIGDMFNTLKYCFKSKESLRLKELESRLAELEK